MPTPDGPTMIRGLYFRGVGLKGWKYSLAKTKTSFYRDCYGAEAYWLVEEDGRKEVVEDFSDLGVHLDVLLVALNQLVLSLMSSPF